MHFHLFKAEHDYDIRFTRECKDVKYRNDDYGKYLSEKVSSRKEINNLEGEWDVPRGHSFFDWPLDDDLLLDVFVANKTLETIEQGKLIKENTWFMCVSFTDPHNPWNANKRFAEKYRKMEDLPLRDLVEWEINSKPIEYTRHRNGYGGEVLRFAFHLSEKETETRDSDQV